MSRKLAIICRDGYKVKQFVETNNIPTDSYIRIKSVNDLLKTSDLLGYIIAKPYPAGYKEMLTYLELEEYKNLNKKYIL